MHALDPSPRPSPSPAPSLQAARRQAAPTVPRRWRPSWSALVLPALALAALGPAPAAAGNDRIGEVDTAFKLIGPDHKIVVEAYDDPGVRGVTCYVSRARTGGIKGGLGLAEDKSEASIACRQTGPISFPQPIPAQQEMYSERISLVFKRLRVVRMVDPARNTLVYLTYSDRLVDGSPQNSVTAVPVAADTPIPVRR